MDRDRFDRLSHLVAAAGTRRAALRLLATGALLGGAASLEGVSAKRRNRNRRKVRAEKDVRAQQSVVCEPEPLVCSTLIGTGCSFEPGNCANKRIGPGTNLTNCNFINVAGDLTETNFRAANLTGACFFAETLLNRPNFRGANLKNACFFEAGLDFADFRGTNVKGASFCFADLTGADFRGSNITPEQIASASTVACSTILPNGQRAVQCAAGETCCIGCTDTDTDPQNCGACNRACFPTGDTCSDGECQCGTGSACAAGLTCCFGECVDIDTDPLNCGFCGVDCGSGATCDGGVCEGS
jgi:hypothetical protein